MRETTRTRRWLLGLLGAAVLAGGLFTVGFFKDRWIDRAQALPPTGSTRELNSPDTGFYYIHGFRLQEGADLPAKVRESYAWDTDTRLSLVEINLAAYREGEISPAGLEQLSALMDALRQVGKRLILRFVYDWDGKNMEVEPTDRRIIETHMAQVAGVVNANKDLIFTLQGLFVGNWGEMNGTRYTGAEHWRALFRQLAGVTDGDLFLAVRMPSQWRQAVSYHGSVEETLAGDPQAGRLGLFNDGMLGSASDLGTYAAPEAESVTELGPWRREEELTFQQQLCRAVPNGGEAVGAAQFSDFPAAVQTLARMHVTYLNRDYDQQVLDRWAAVSVEEPGPWQGMDGLTYIQRHLGYRYALTGSELRYDFLRNSVQVRVTVANEGFAPAYAPLKARLLLEDDAGGLTPLTLEGDLRRLGGGGESLTLEREVDAGALAPGSYRLWVEVRREDTDEPLALANEGWTAEKGNPIGRIEPK